MENKTYLLEDILSIAKRAYQHVSFDPDKRGERIVQEYSAELENDLASIEDKEAYTLKYKSMLTKWLHSMSNVASTMITGPANFNVERNRKRSDAADKRYNEFRQWRERTVKPFKKITSEESFEMFLSGIKNTIEVIKQIDSGENTYTSKALLVANVAGKIERVASKGDIQGVEKCLDIIRPYNAFTSRHKVWRLPEFAKRVAEKNGLNADRTNQEMPFQGGVLIIDYTQDRVQIKHESKPDKSVIYYLKSKAFRWSPTNKVWQRKITSSAIFDAKNICGIR